MRSELGLLALAAALVLGACGGDSGPSGLDLGVDLGLPDGAPPDMGEGGVDLGSTDGGPDGGLMRDLGAEPSPSCFDELDVFDHCLCDDVTTCTAGDCGSGEQCLRDLCGRMTCQASGALCFSAADCAEGSECVASDAGFSICQATGGGCSDARDCPAGFACEAASCVDRRRGCSPTDVCPAGYVCESRERLGAYCRRAYRGCDNNLVCAFQSSCVELNDEGARVCLRGGGDCDTSLDCDEGEVCGTDPRTERTACGASGPCGADEDCPMDSECLSLLGDGVGECAVVGACRASAECGPGEICGAPATGGPTACF
ncbi:MAG: hypothetical protein AAGH15_23935 [Myxococcota bacterium]